MPSRAAAKSQAQIYSVHPGVAMMQTWVAALPAKTGRSLEEWLSFTRVKGPAGEKEQREWLKKECGLPTNTAWWIAERASGKAPGLADENPEAYLAACPGYVDAMYRGKENLRPLHDELISRAQRLFPAVRICPCKTIVPFYREHVVAQIKPATRIRLDFGLCLKGFAGDIPARVVDTGGFAKGDRITHKIALTTAPDLDAEVERWLKVAWELDAPG